MHVTYDMSTKIIEQDWLKIVFNNFYKQTIYFAPIKLIQINFVDEKPSTCLDCEWSTLLTWISLTQAVPSCYHHQDPLLRINVPCTRVQVLEHLYLFLS